MSRLLGMLGTLIAYLCVSTVITLGLTIGYAASKGYIDKDKLSKMLAVAQESGDGGGDKEEAATGKNASDAGKPADTQEQPSLDEIAMQRAIRSRHLELREQSLQTSLEQVRTEQQKLVDQRTDYDRLKNAFDKQLADLHEGAQATGRENIRLIWENVKPKQAKDQILQMVAAGQQQDVVAILSAMPISKRAKIIGEFKTDEETKKLDEILDLIRRGMPDEKVIDGAQQQLTQSKPNTTQ